MYEKLPQELKDYPYFCGWKYENHNGNRTKVPKTVKGRNADNSNLKDFCGFDEIIKKIYDFDGIGITVISVQSGSAKETLYEKLKKQIMTRTKAMCDS